MFLPRFMNPNTARPATQNAPLASMGSADCKKIEAAQRMFVSSVWTLAQDSATKDAPGGALNTPVYFDATDHGPSPSFPIYVKREATRPAASASLQGLHLSPAFFAFPLPVQLGLVWGMGAAARDERYLGDEKLVEVQTYGQNAKGFAYPSQPTADVRRAFGSDIAQKTAQSWDKFVRDNNLIVPDYPAEPPHVPEIKVFVF